MWKPPDGWMPERTVSMAHFVDARSGEVKEPVRWPADVSRVACRRGRRVQQSGPRPLNGRAGACVPRVETGGSYETDPDVVRGRAAGRLLRRPAALRLRADEAGVRRAGAAAASVRAAAGGGGAAAASIRAAAGGGSAAGVRRAGGVRAAAGVLRSAAAAGAALRGAAAGAVLRRHLGRRVVGLAWPPLGLDRRSLAVASQRLRLRAAALRLHGWARDGDTAALARGQRAADRAGRPPGR